jgi:hypothetical protein
MRRAAWKYGLPMLAVAASIACPANSWQREQAPASGRQCTADGLIHASVSPDITQHVNDAVRTLAKNSRIREVAKLDLPCGFHLDPRYGWSLVLTNGTEFRRYVENNPFGFAPAFGFSERTTKPYTLNYGPVAAGELRPADCVATLEGIKSDLKLCSSFGSSTCLFGTTSRGQTTLLAHYVVRGSRLEQDFQVAEISAHVESIFFLASPDTPGGTITLILSDRDGIYRAYLDTSSG